MTSKEIREMSFEELVDYATRTAHDGLIQGGGKGLWDSMYAILSHAITWNRKK